MKNNKDYYRIGTQYLKMVDRPLSSGDTLKCMIPWGRQLIIDDHGKDFLAKIPKYDGFCCQPSHTNYQEKIVGFYNSYFKLNYEPKEGDFSNTLNFLKNIFGPQIEIGLDYFKILYEIPYQILPILCLVSKERATGKTLFINWLKAIFEANMTYNTNDDFRSQFNADWAGKLIIAVDEVFLDRNEDLERIKNLSTARTFKAEAKGKDKVETEFFSKIILASNKELDFIKIDDKEIRFWVIKLQKIEKQDDNLLSKMTNEIPHFIYFLLNREFSITNTTRMWFTPEQIWTKALARIVNRNRNEIENELVTIIYDIMEIAGIGKFEFCLIDLQDLLTKSFNRISSAKIKLIVQESWQLTPSTNANRYTKYSANSDGSINEGNCKGRIYAITKAYLYDNYVDLLT
jgi:Family of unknown function (DUF5906)